MSGWREWLERCEHHLRSCSETRDSVIDNLIEGFRLLAEAVEASVTTDMHYTFYKDPEHLFALERKAHAKAVQFLRGVGR